MQFKGTSVSTAEPVTNWRRRSSCLEADSGLFFGPDDETAAARQVREGAASTVCVTCPVLMTALNDLDQSCSPIFPTREA